MLTLFHHSLPKWALADGGWTSRSLVDYFITFSNDVLGALGADIEYLVTFNEPTIFIMLTHCSGIWPPGPKKSTAQGLQCLTPVVGDYARAIANIEAAHRAVYRSFSNTDLQIGVAHNVGFNVAEHVWDEAATAVAKALLKFSFIDSIKDSLDFCGLNYYGKEITRGGSVAIRDDEEYSESGRVVYPAGLYLLLKDFHDRYRNDARSTIQRYIITENGISDASDVMRPAYIIEHLLAVAQARREGVPVAGYLHWTVSDNWEWADGYCPKFGLVEVDRLNDLQRRKRPSFDLYRQIATSRRITGAQRQEAWRAVKNAAETGASHLFCRASDGQTGLDEPVPRPFSAKDWRFDARHLHEEWQWPFGAEKLSEKWWFSSDPPRP